MMHGCETPHTPDSYKMMRLADGRQVFCSVILLMDSDGSWGGCIKDVSSSPATAPGL